MMEFMHIDLALPQCPERLAGCRILHLTDMHLTGLDREKDRLKHILSEQYDLIAITGDSCWQLYLANPFNRGHLDPFTTGLSWRGLAQEAKIETALAMLDFLTLHTGCEQIYAIQGNHDPHTFMSRLAETPIRILANTAVTLELHGEPVNLLGLSCYGRSPADVITSLLQCEPGRFTIAMSHYPEFACILAAGGADMVLCGHTHGGQICLPGRRPLTTHSQTGIKFVAGLDHFNNTAVYTCRGFGFEKARLFCPSEVAVLTLQRGPRDYTRITRETL